MHHDLYTFQHFWKKISQINDDYIKLKLWTKFRVFMYHELIDFNLDKPNLKVVLKKLRHTKVASIVCHVSTNWTHLETEEFDMFF